MHDVRAIPPELNFGALKIGSSKQRQLVLKSRLNKAFSIASCSSDSPSLAVSQKVSSPDDVKQEVLQLEQHALKSGKQKTNIAIIVQSQEDRSSYTIHVPVYYYGVAESQSHSK